MNLSILEDAIQSAKHSGKLKAVLVISIDKSVGIHPQHGVPQLYFDQLHVIANHLQAINKDMQTVDTLVPPNLTVQLTSAAQFNCSTYQDQSSPTSSLQINPTPLSDLPGGGTTFTKKQLLQCHDWPEWQQSIYKMLDQYHDQGMFSDPLPLPKSSHALQMLWV
jgi:hypothetical protein